MLILSRKVGEQLLIGRDVVVTVVEIRPGKVRLAIAAPDQTKVLRAELEWRNDTDIRQEATPG